MFRSTGDGACAFLADFLLDGFVGGTGVDGLGFGWLGYDTVEGGGGDEFGFTAVPFGEDLGRGSTAEDAGVDEAGEFDAGDVAGCAVDA